MKWNSDVVTQLPYCPRIVIQNGASGADPLFCVPGAGASVAAFCDLADSLGAQIPIHGLQARGYDGLYPPYEDVPAAAADYVKAIREVSPKGPYRLLGHSFGGWVAFEMARQLAAAGDEVKSLTLLDSKPPLLSYLSTIQDRIEILIKLITLFELRLGRSVGISHAELERLEPVEQLSLILRKLIDCRLLPAKTSIHVLQEIVTVFEANLRTHYRPSGQYLGPIQLVAACEQNSVLQICDKHAHMQWLEFAPMTTFHVSAGNHVTMLMSPHAKQLAQCLSQQLMIINGSNAQRH